MDFEWKNRKTELGTLSRYIFKFTYICIFLCRNQGEPKETIYTLYYIYGILYLVCIYTHYV